jgi:hypothetical protein
MVSVAALRDWRVPARLTGRAEMICYAIAALPVLISLTNPGIILDIYTHDLAGFTFDAMWRVTHGQIPHTDFHSPVGQAFYWPFMAVGLFGPVTAKSVIAANALVALVAAAATGALLRNRASPLVLVAALLVVVGAAIAPRDIGHGPTIFSYLALYNRWGWALIAIVALAVFLPRRDEGADKRAVLRADVTDGAILGMLGACLILLKVTYFAAALGLLGGAALLRTLNFRTALIAGAAFLVTLGLVELLFHDLAAYVEDLRMAAAAQSLDLVDRKKKLFGHLAEGLVVGAGIAALLAFARPPRTMLGYLRESWRTLAIGALIVGAGVLIATQNFQPTESTLFAVAVLVVIQRALFSAPSSEARPAPVHAAFVAAALAVVSLFAPAIDIASVFTHRVMAESGAACRLIALRKGSGEDLMFPTASFPETQRALTDKCGAYQSLGLGPLHEEYAADTAASLADGAKLLRKHVNSSEESVLALDFANPFPMLIGAQSPKHALMWWDVGRSYSFKSHPRGADMLADTDVIIQPAKGRASFGYGDAMMIVYGDEIRRDFQIVEDSKYWRIWARQPGHGREHPLTN